MDPSVCPICGEPNRCAMVEGNADCWCCDIPIPPEVLARIPEKARRVACVCRACVEEPGRLEEA